MMDLSKYIVLNIRNHATWTDISCEYNINKIRHFTEDEVKDICQMFQDGYSINDVAEKYQCKKSKLYMLKQRKIWTEISSNYDF